MHATIGIPNGRGLLSPIIAMIMACPKTKNYKDKTIHLIAATQQALADWQALLPVATKNPMPCTNIVPAPADFGGYCNASKQGAGGVWYRFAHKLPPLVWHVKFPPDIQCEVVSHQNPQGKFINSDLKMMGLLLQSVVLERFVDLKRPCCLVQQHPNCGLGHKAPSHKSSKGS